MRTLLIDNYDSFTYNLVHQIAAVTGDEPEVVRNDEPVDLTGFDAVVISPGPGTVECAADFGVCRSIVERCELPLLGICLGHQGIARWHGGRVGPAPEPRHGRLSPVRHDGTGLFAGIPSPFQVVRYHSLAVTGLPAELEATAWTPDGVLMGLRHRNRPMWGVQFHPESVCTEHGDRLIRNFTELAAAHHRRHGTGGPGRAPHRVPAARRAPKRPPAPPRRRLEVLVETVPARCDGETAFERLFGRSRHAFWLDSSRPDGGSGRFSILGDAAGPLARVATADVWTGTVTIQAGERRELVTGSFFDWLAADLRSARIEPPAGAARPPFDFALGWVGYLGYELKAQCGGERAHRSPDPDAVLVFADRAVVLDHAAGTTYLLALAEDGRHRPAREWLRETADRLREPAGEDPAPPPACPPAGPIGLRHDRDRYLRLIGAAQRRIAAGESYEVCLTNMAEAAGGTADPWHAYRVLRRASPAPFGALLRLGALSVLSTSPERFLRVGADGAVEARPIKGTRPRGADPEQDEALRRDLLGHEKDRSENLMIVDLVRNDLGRCARIGSVRVTGMFQVETYDTVHQLVSTVRARLRADRTAVDCVRAAFPGGSMTGAPKVRTMRIIDELEGAARGVYSGAIGYFSLTGSADLSMVIRTAVMTGDRLRYGTGGAITALSDPAAEFEETAVKAAPLLALTRNGFPDRVAPRPVRPAGR